MMQSWAWSVFLLLGSIHSSFAGPVADLPKLISQVYSDLIPFDDQLPVTSPSNQLWKEAAHPQLFSRRLSAAYLRAAERVRKFDDRNLTPENRIVYQNLKRQLDQREKSFHFTASRLYSFEHMNNFATELLWDANPGISSFSFDDPKHLSVFRERFEIFSKLFPEHLRPNRNIATQG